MKRGWIIFALLLTAGCGDGALETGYKPKPLTDSITLQKGYYASPFTEAAQAQQMERDQELQARRPKPGY